MDRKLDAFLRRARRRAALRHAPVVTSDHGEPSASTSLPSRCLGLRCPPARPAFVRHPGVAAGRRRRQHTDLFGLFRGAAASDPSHHPGSLPPQRRSVVAAEHTPYPTCQGATALSRAARIGITAERKIIARHAGVRVRPAHGSDGARAFRDVVLRASTRCSATPPALQERVHPPRRSDRSDHAGSAEIRRPPQLSPPSCAAAGTSVISCRSGRAPAPDTLPQFEIASSYGYPRGGVDAPSDPRSLPMLDLAVAPDEVEWSETTLRAAAALPLT
jgi:hypothetical protein